MEFDYIQDKFNLLKKEYSNNKAISLIERRDFLLNLKKEIIKRSEDMVKALSKDYGHRSGFETKIADIHPVIGLIDYCVGNLKKWMKKDRRKTGLLLSPAKVYVQYQPKGVVGIVVPWNFPINLAFMPLINAISAGNYVLIKPSEYTPNINQVVKEIIENVFAKKNLVHVVEGEAAAAKYFCNLPFDHLLFTGSSNIGKEVLKDAANNLTPVTLELGGKSPVIIDPEINIELAVERIIFGKSLNAGQVCLAPDYILLPKEKVKSFITCYCNKFSKMYGSLNNNDDYSSVINTRIWDRLKELLEDAKSKGANIVSANNEKPNNDTRKMATQLITDVNDDMQVMQGEIFGPLLPIIPYENIDNTIEYINSKPRPLALYIMSFNKKLIKKISENTISGSIAVNDTILQAAINDAPFGGVGHSGMGYYKGHEGFKTFSHAKTVLIRNKLYPYKYLFPPFKTKLHNLFLRLMKLPSNHK